MPNNIERLPKQMTIAKPNKVKKTWVYLIVPAIIFAVFFSYSYFSASKKSNLEAEIAQFPGMKLLLEQHPEIREQFIQDAIIINNGGPDAAAAQSRFAALIKPYLRQYIGQASDESLIEFVDQFLVALDEVRGKSPQFCSMGINDQANGIAIVLSPSTAKGLTNAMSKVIETAIANPQPQPNDEWAAQRLQQVMEVIYAKNDPNFTTDFTNPTIKPENICYSAIIIYKTMKETLSAAEFGSVLRYISVP